MNLSTVQQWLDAIGVPREVVSIGVEADDAWCVLREDTDGGEPEYEVFWREQGNRYDWARFTDEHVACFYLFGRLAWTQTASGAITRAGAVAGVAADVPAQSSSPDTGPIPVVTPAAD